MKSRDDDVCGQNIEALCPAQLSRSEEFSECVPSTTIKTTKRKSRGLSTAQSTVAHLMTGFGLGCVWYLSGDTSVDSVKNTLKSITTPTPYLFNTVTYERMDVEIAAKGSIYEGFPEHDVRLRIESYLPATIMIGSFVLFWFALVPIIFPLFKPRSDFGKVTFGRLRSAHNFVLFLYSGFCTFLTAKFMYERGDFSNGVEQLLCSPVEGTYIRPLYWSFVLSKVAEWIDTAFMIWVGRRPPQFIHLYHHATTFWLFVLIANFPGSQKMGLLLNGGVHTMMYSHYWRQWPSFLVPVITTSQIVQLATAMWSWRATPHHCPGHLADFAQHNVLEYATPFLMVPVFFHQFNKYFAKRWFKI